MKALILNRYGAPDVLELVELPRPEAGPGEVLVRLEFSAVNPVDAGVRAGRILPEEAERLPMMLGWDGAGTVNTIGSDVTELAPGDRVMAIAIPLASGIGLHAEYAALPLEQVVALPDSVSLEEAAATPLAGITALNAIEALGLPVGSRIHVNNPRGAVGHFAVQIAKALGFVVDEAPKAREVDGAIDVRGGMSAWETFDIVRDGGAFATVIPEWWKPGGVYAPARGITPLVVENAPTRSDLARLAAWLAAGDLSPQIEAVLPLAQGAEAHRRLEAPGLTHKIILEHGA
jgi:NADPH:quinone reductase-like Zn-dependent oxidoreductase